MVKRVPRAILELLGQRAPRAPRAQRVHKVLLVWMEQQELRVLKVLKATRVPLVLRLVLEPLRFKRRRALLAERPVFR